MKPTKPLRAILYARVSKLDEGSQDPEGQLGALREWCSTRGWSIVAEETDRITGDPTRRKGDPPGLCRALQAIAERRADVLAVFAADRIVRSPIALLQIISRVQQLGGHVASLQDGADLDTTSDVGELLVFIRGWFSRMELKLIRSRTMAGLARVRAEGRTLGRHVGTRKGGAVAPPGERGHAPAHAAVAALRAQGVSWGDVARRLGCHVSAARRALARKVVGTGGPVSIASSVETA